jgi:hypothetical protein
MLAKLINQHSEVKTKLANSMAWLVKHYNHADFMKIVSDRNKFSVELANLEFKINKLKQGKPMLGIDEKAMCETTILLTKNN